MRHATKNFAPLGLLLLLSLAFAACSEEPTAVPMRSQLKPVVTSLPESTATPPPTTEAEATADARATLAAAPTEEGQIGSSSGGETVLPDDAEAVVVQLARIEPGAWEPDIQAQMAPHFSLQSGGYAVFDHIGGESDTGWYQSVLTGTGTIDLLTLLMDDIDVLGIAERRGEPDVLFETGPDGQPAETGVLGVIYVRSGDREGRLVIPEEEMEDPDPDDPDFDRLRRLHVFVKAVEVWKDGVARDFTQSQEDVLTDALGFWSDVQKPYTPDSADAFGTAARSRVPGDAPVANWPLRDENGDPRPIAELVEAGYGQTPSEFHLEDEDLVLMLREDHAREVQTLLEGRSGFWGPLWRAAGEPAKYFIGLRAAVPGGNFVDVDYEYVLPRRGIGLAVADAAAGDQPDSEQSVDE